MATTPRSGRKSTARWYPLDALLDDEALAQRCWLDLHMMSMRRPLSQPLDDLRFAAWRAWCAVGTQREAVQRAYGR